MNILSLEDRGSTAYYFDLWVENSGHTILKAYNINDAQSHWNNRNSVSIDCIVLDLQVPLDGLTPNQRERAEGGTLAGWIWLSDYVLKTDLEMKKRIIIYSDYLPVLHERIPASEYTGIKMVPKRQRGSSADVVADFINTISKLSSHKN